MISDRPKPDTAPFPWPLFLAAIGLVIAAHSLAVDLHGLTLAPGGVPHPLLTVVAACLLGYCASTLYSQRFAHRPFWPALLSTVLSAHWLALDAHYFLAKVMHLPVALLIAGAGGATLLAAWLVHHWRHELETGRSLVRIKATEFIAQRKPLRALILLVSKPASPPQFHSDPPGPAFPATVAVPPNARPGAKAGLLSGDLKQDAEDMDPGKIGWPWNWQQQLRAVLPHQERLAELWLIGTESDYVQSARRLFAEYLPELARRNALHTAPPVDFEKFDRLMVALRHVITGVTDADEVARTRPEDTTLANWLETPLTPLLGEFDADEVAVDITGGIKIASIAGAVLTLNRAVLCQYVQTEGLNTKGAPEPYIYDFRWDKSLVLD
jgi:hypothetical protein